MEVYLLKSDMDHFQAFQMCRSEDLDVAFKFVGRSLKDEWVPLSVQPIDEEEKRSLPHGDFPYVTTFPIMSGRAMACLKTVMNSGVELLPLTWDRERLYALNVTTVLDGLDEAQSQIQWLPSGPLFAIKEHAFIPDVVRGHVVFKLKQDPLVNVYVSEVVAARIQACGLVGARLERVWSAPD